jgi:hypothetical protein
MVKTARLFLLQQETTALNIYFIVEGDLNMILPIYAPAGRNQMARAWIT